MTDLKPLPSPMSWVWKSVEVVQCEAKISRARKPYFLLQLRVIDTEYYVYLNLVRTERATWKWDYLHEATCGQKPTSSVWDRDPYTYVSKQMQVCLEPVNYGNKWYWDVRKMIHIDAKIPPWRGEENEPSST